jgi:translation initiation factor 5B
MKLRQPIVTVAGHVDHGKTSILDNFRGSSVQEGEAGGITQKISFTKYPIEKIRESCPMIENGGIDLKIPGFLFIDTPGHASFTSLRKRGGSLADLAILVISIKDGIKPQTAEVLQILKNNKVPFLVALNKIDSISGWQFNKNLKDGINSQAINVKQEFDQALMTFQGSLQEHGFESNLFYDITDFTKEIAIVPCSAKTGEGISELLFVLSGLSQKFLKDNLKIGEDARGLILEVKKGKSQIIVEAILYDGQLKTGKEIAISGINDVITSKIRAIEEIEPLSFRYKKKSEVSAATGLRLQLTTTDGLVPGMPFREIKNNLGEITESFNKEMGEIFTLDKLGLIVKADSLGSLEAIIHLLKESNIKILKAGIGSINKSDLISAKANEKIDPLNSVILGYNVEVDTDIESKVLGKIKIIKNAVIYALIDSLKEFREEKAKDIERERLLSLTAVCKLEILSQHVFRNSNPAIFGIKILCGKLKVGTELIDEANQKIGRVKSLQLDKDVVIEAGVGKEIAISIPGIMFDRRLGNKRYLYSDISEIQFKKFSKNKDLLSSDEIRILREINEIKRFDSE